MNLQSWLADNYEGANGLRDLLYKTNLYVGDISKKMNAMQIQYLELHPDLYSSPQKSKLSYFLGAYLYKQHMVAWHMEEIWGMTHTSIGDRRLLVVLQNIFDDHRTDDGDLLLLSFLVDNFLLQATAFLDFYILYLGAFFNTPNARGKGIIGKLKMVDAPEFQDKAVQVAEFFGKHIFSTPERFALSIISWGGVLRDLRNSTVHRDQEQPSFEVGEALVKQKSQDWPDELREIECARFCEDVQGEMFKMVSQLAAVLYGVDWQPGPYREGMFIK